MSSSSKVNHPTSLPDTTLNWAERILPTYTWPYLRLSRFDRPIGTWLLLWPCWWAIGLASTLTASAPDTRAWFGLPDLWLMLIFGIGALAMRGAGCTYNDIVDRNLDSKVARTAGRPIPSGQVSVLSATLWVGAQGIVGLVVLLMLNDLTLVLGILSLAIVASYPFMKRITWWPQIFLGLAFNYGALLGWSAATENISVAAILLYLGGIFWTLGYDTIYAHQDTADDALVGIKSSALRLKTHTKTFLIICYTVVIVLTGLAGALVGTGWLFWICLAVGATQLLWQALRVDINSPSDCLAKFRSNNLFGCIVFASIVLGSLTA